MSEQDGGLGVQLFFSLQSPCAVFFAFFRGIDPRVIRGSKVYSSSGPVCVGDGASRREVLP